MTANPIGSFAVDLVAAPQPTSPSSAKSSEELEYLAMHGVTEVWIHLRDREPVPGLALAWGDRLGGRWAFITYEFDGRVRTEWLPLTALLPRLSDSDVALDEPAASSGQVDDPTPGVRAS